MRFRLAVSLAVVLAVPAPRAFAQDPGSLESQAVAASSAESSADQSQPGSLILPPAIGPGQVTFGAPTPANPFTSIRHDLRNFFSRDTANVLAILAPATIVGFTWDTAGIEESQEHLSRRVFQPGNVAGSFLVQTGAAFGTWAVGKMSGSERTEALGSDLIRAQIVSQAVVQGIKFTTRRQRPDASNRHSFPSGHTASAFATASVIERHYGKKIGLPAYAFATYVGLARLSANKHHISDVVMGAGIGIAAGRTVTVGIGGAKFALGVAPTQGGGAVMFTRK
ncbi:MAG: phosphatase PAP2 family protein [Vicinamibacterales bacterium]